jgi:hypothetical protein
MKATFYLRKESNYSLQSILEVTSPYSKDNEVYKEIFQIFKVALGFELSATKATIAMYLCNLIKDASPKDLKILQAEIFYPYMLNPEVLRIEVDIPACKLPIKLEKAFIELLYNTTAKYLES